VKIVAANGSPSRTSERRDPAGTTSYPTPPEVRTNIFRGEIVATVPERNPIIDVSVAQVGRRLKEKNVWKRRFYAL
jgi:hypothetical protein